MQAHLAHNTGNDDGHHRSGTHAMPPVSSTIGEGLVEAARRWPDAVAIEAGPLTLTFAQLWHHAQQVARGLQDMGVRRGSHVALLLGNCASQVVCFHAALLAGARVVNLSQASAPAQLREQIEDAHVEVLVSSARMCGMLAGADGPRCIVCTESASDLEPETAPDAVPSSPVRLAQLLADRGAPQDLTCDARTDEVAVLQYTGGTTGAPKAAMLTHANFAAIPRAMREWCGDAVGPGKVLLLVLPLSHVFGLALMCLAVANGLRTVLRAGFDADATLDDVEHRGVSIVFGVPAMFSALAQHPRARRTDWSRVQICGCGGAPLSPDTFDAFREATGVAIQEGYSLTEIADLGTWQPLDRPPERGTVGLPFPRTTLEIVDLETGTKVLPPGEAGEVCFRGPQLMAGYWNRPEETAHAMRGGRFHTGDVGRLDARGYLTLMDRMKDMLIVGGHKVFSRRVEEAIAAHPDVAEACVLGVPAPHVGQVCKAVVALRPGAALLTLARLQDFLRPRLGRYELPLELQLVFELPRNAAGKVVKAQFAHAPAAAPDAAAPAGSGGTLREALARRICELLVQAGQLDAAVLSAHARFESYAMDSITVIAAHGKLAQPFPQVPSTVFYEFATADELAAHLAQAYPEAAARWVGADAPAPARVPAAPAVHTGVADERGADAGTDDGHAIAIIGLSGRYALARTPDEFWENLKAGRDCMTDLPPERWPLEGNWIADPSEAIASGKSYCRRLGYLEGFADFDPMFFGIAPREALAMDPQERLFVQACWEALEDAAYTREGLRRACGGSVGVFAGITNPGYDLYGPALWARGQRLFPYTWFSSLANRVSYLLDLHGPSMPVDTMCSSSLTAIHLACQHIRRGECELALAGGVNVYVHPAVHAVLCMRRMLSPDGRSRAFGAGANGYAPGEGAGVVVLKRLARAVADGDHIHAVIRGSAINHGGRTNGYTVPSPAAQRALIRAALCDAGLDARAVSYIEAHGTGTELGDPIEIAGLHQAFSADTAERGFCAIGSVKTNVGHCESAAGMAGLTKVILQMRHGQLAPSLHADTLNPRIDFEPTAFRLQRALGEWRRPVVEEGGVGRELPRIAGISSFGAGGANAHLLVQEYVPPARAAVPAGPALVVLSAPSAGDLHTRARQLEAALAPPRAAHLTLADVAWTLQVGREPMRHRLAFVADCLDDLREKLLRFADGGAGPGMHTGEVDPAAPPRVADAAGLEQLAAAWVAGASIDWEAHAPAGARRVPLPTYRFGGERYWAGDLLRAGAAPAAVSMGANALRLHPLVHGNTSTFAAQRFSSRFEGSEAVLRDHVLGGRPVLPAMAYPEIVRVALAAAADGEGVLSLRDLAWMRPFAIDGAPASLHVELRRADDGAVAFSVLGEDAAGARPLLARGSARLEAPASQRLDLDALRARCGDPLDLDAAYAAFERAGLAYGPAYRVLDGLQAGVDADGTRFALARLVLPAAAASDALQLHPCLLDGGIQAAAGLALGAEADGDAPGFTVPFALGSLEMLQALPAGPVFAYVRRAGEAQPAPGLSVLDMDLCDAGGALCVRIRGLAGRPSTALAAPAAATPAVASDSAEAPAADTVYFTARREPLVLPPDAGTVAPEGEHMVAHAFTGTLLPGLREAVAQLLPQARWLDPGEAGRGFEQQAGCLFALLQDAPRAQRPLLLQVVARAEGDDACLAGLQGMLASAALENPQITAQLVLADAGAPAEPLAQALRRLTAMGSGLLRLDPAGGLAVERCGEQPLPPAAQQPWRDGGVYFVTGGAGGVGVLFAEEIARRARGAAVVLASRSAPGVPAAQRLEALRAGGLRVLHQRMDVTDAQSVRQAVEETLRRFGRIDGVLHAAGVLRDGLLARKTAEEFQAVLAPKVAGMRNLDEATRALPLDFFACFSSTAALGNIGQTDYAAANAYLDAAAARRDALVAQGLRQGRTVAVGWPLWRDGGMQVGAATLARMRKEWGVEPLPAPAAMDAFARALASGQSRVIVTHGEADKLRRAVGAVGAVATRAAQPPAGAARVAAAPAGDAAQADPALLRATESLLAEVLGTAAGMERERIDAQASFDNYGVDSILVMDMTEALEKTLGPLPKTLFFEYPSIARLARRLAATHGAKLAAALGVQPTAAPAAPPAAAVPVPVPVPVPAPDPLPRAPAAPRDMAIAVIGMAGRYPGARDLVSFWDNLRAGRDSVTEIPAARWDHGRYFDAESRKPGTTYGKWGGFIDDVYCFDPLFFNIAPREAEIMDPQERLFLQCTYAALEDAGYTRDMLGDREDPARARRVGVFVGVMSTEFQLFGAQEQARGNNVALTGSAASIANRVSYFLDVSGPSMAVDTMCSSSLTAIELACQSIRHGGCTMAIAGGVNLTLHPNKYLMLAQGRFISSTGQCASFGQGGDGYVPGEGVGALLLKPLEAAIADGDQIHGVIRAAATNHGGKANGYTVPNPNAQAAVIAEGLRASGVDARDIGYLEAHGTGTTLGDPIEIAGLSKAFAEFTAESGFCAIGSVKSNVGHCEGAAGVAGVTKVLLQLRHGALAPSLHSETLNPNIDFAATPFAVQRAFAPWPRRAPGRPRLAGVSSFGAGGSNAHVVIEEHIDAGVAEEPAGQDGAVFVLSARDRERLDERCTDLLSHLRRPEARALSLHAIAHTLQTGREAMACRLAFVAGSLDAACAMLATACEGEGKAAGLQRGDLRDRAARDALLQDEDLGALVEGWIARGRLDKLAAAWVRGHAVPWRRLYAGRPPRRVSLPTYPFARIVHTIPWVGGKQPAAPAPVPPAGLDNGAQDGSAPQGEDLTAVARWDVLPWAALPEPPEGVAPPAPAETVLVHEAGTDAAWLPAWASGVRQVPLRPEDGARDIAARLQAAGPFAHLLWLAPRGAAVPPADAGADADAQFATIARGLRLFQALHALGRTAGALALTVLTFRAQALADGDPVDLAAAALHGLVGTLAKECGRWAVRLVDADDGAPPALAALLRVPPDAAGNAVVHRAGRWHRQALVPLRDAGARGPGLVDGGVYVVIGGAGGLGRVFSEHLARSARGVPVWVGRRPADDAAVIRALDDVARAGVRPLYLCADASSPAQLRTVRERVLAAHGRIDGVVLTAMGATDRALVDTGEAQLRAVLMPKLDVPLAAEAAFADLPVRQWILFSSNNAFAKGAGNAGYSAGCAFLDAFAHGLRQRVAGAVKLVHWGWWGEVGIGHALPPAFKKRLALAGVGVLDAPTAMRALDALLASPRPQMLFQRNAKPQAVELLGCFRADGDDAPPPPVREAAQGGAGEPARGDDGGVTALLRERLARVLKIDPRELDAHTVLPEYGMDSISSADFVDAVNEALGTRLEVVDVLTHPTLAALGTHIQSLRAPALVKAPAPAAILAVASTASTPAAKAPPVLASAAPAPVAAQLPADEPIAIVGLHGFHPGAADLEAHWDNLRAGRDCIGEIDPAWLSDELFHPDPATAAASGRNYCRWGGRLDPAWGAAFDASRLPTALSQGPLHPVEAMFLRCVQALLAEAGHDRRGSAERDALRIGLFMCASGGGDGAGELSGGLRANRASYLFDLRGPSVALDTMSSSSLAAVHYACAALRRGECRSAIAGGFSALSPGYYRLASRLRFLGSHAGSRSFTAGDGYLPGECAGAVLLKPLRHARADGDTVLAVLRGGASNFAGGDTPPFVPNPHAQARLIGMSLAAAGVEARGIGCVEAAANGTALADAVEFAALCSALRPLRDAGLQCALGSVKAQIGHAAAASGISQLARAVLQLRHRTLAPTPLRGPLNPGIRLQDSPFVLPREAQPWPRQVLVVDGARTELPRRALVNSFGAGGSYVSVVLEEADGAP
jgi:acyl transferase domain-containing protein/acyl-CoA synthetase (AMP-forming)/AMP-acid ligase II/acyl carrier protein